MADAAAFFEAVRKGDLVAIREALDGDPGLIEARNELGQGGVLLGKYHRQDAAVALMIERGAALNIWEASAVGDTDLVMRLLDADPGLLDAASPDGFTPLGLAAFFGNETIVHNLLAKGADPNRPSSNAMQVAPLHAAVAGACMDAVKLLVEAGAAVNQRQSQGFSALHGAAGAGNTEMVRYLLAHGADPEARSAAGQSVLDLALSQGREEVVRLLEAR